MYTLQDFLTMTKGQEYLMAIGAMVLFTLFWLLLSGKASKKQGTEQSK
ncbi:MAG: hypothetical protein OEV49_14765 [candidate division Zixibacteria bacterium]|nr:hypothetical protein [candidate division Zixibacteria bacterium]MDH3938519.1 hypothetical protein [candidate division Zixibacteria bacterium]